MSACGLIVLLQDSYLMQHVFSDAERPKEKANPICVTFNSRGSLTLASVDNSRTLSQPNATM